jgi:hypothetical protein
MASFLFNPARLEHPYGVGIFDDLHNYLPEVLYDSNMFDSTLIAFLQRRVQGVFSEEYARNRTQYRLFQQTQRRANSGILLPASLMPVPWTVRPIAPPATPPRRPSVHLQPPPAPRRATARVQTTILEPTALGDGLSALLLSALGGGTGMQGLDQILRGDFMDPVAVAPTPEDLQRATFLTSVEPAPDVTCPICQDHFSEENTTREWRYIRHCNHGFHRSCIDHWFQEHVQCPVCRFDIRETATETTA